MTYIKKTFTEFDDSPNLDAFGRLRVTGVPLNIWSSKFLYTQGTDVWFTKTNGSGAITYLTNESALSLTVGTGSSDYAIAQSREYMHYVPGKSQLIVMTGCLNGAEQTTKRIGYFDDNNGLFFELSGGVLYAVVRSNTSGVVVDTKIPQNLWSADKLDGTGPSGLTLDITKVQIFEIDFQWLGAGRVRFGFSLDNGPVIAHIVRNANFVTGAYMATPNLPVRYEVRNTGTVSAGSSLKAICTSVTSEGGSLPPGRELSISNGITQRGLSARGPVLAIQMAPTFNGKANRKIAEILDFDLYTTTNDIYWELVHCQDCTFTGATWTAAHALSCVQYSTNLTAITGNMETIDSGFGIAGTKNSPAAPATKSTDFTTLYRRIVQNIDATNGEALALFATPFTGTSNVSASMCWAETD